MTARVTGKRTSIWLGGTGSHFDVHTEDDMILIEADDHGDTVEVFISPGLFGRVRACMDVLEGRPRGPQQARTVTDRERTAAIRAWAQQHKPEGQDLPSRGRLPGWAIRAYKEARHG